jgi:hypothetical protein
MNKVSKKNDGIRKRISSFYKSIAIVAWETKKKITHERVGTIDGVIVGSTVGDSEGLWYGVSKMNEAIRTRIHNLVSFLLPQGHPDEFYSRQSWINRWRKRGLKSRRDCRT